MTISTVFLIVAAVCFLIAAIYGPQPKPEGGRSRIDLWIFGWFWIVMSALFWGVRIPLS